MSARRHLDPGPDLRAWCFVGVAGRPAGHRSTSLAVRRRLGGRATAPASRQQRSVMRSDTVAQPLPALGAGDDASGGHQGAQQAAARPRRWPASSIRRRPVWYVVVRFSLAIGLPLGLILGPVIPASRLSGIGADRLPPGRCAASAWSRRDAFVDNRADGARERSWSRSSPTPSTCSWSAWKPGLGLEAAVRPGGPEVHGLPSADRRGIRPHRPTNWRPAEAGPTPCAPWPSGSTSTSIKSFVALLIQTDALGVSIAQSLRTYSAEMRRAPFPQGRGEGDAHPGADDRAAGRLPHAGDHRGRCCSRPSSTSCAPCCRHDRQLSHQPMTRSRACRSFWPPSWRRPAAPRSPSTAEWVEGATAAG